jgi:hypothetical protein
MVFRRGIPLMNFEIPFLVIYLYKINLLSLAAQSMFILPSAIALDDARN